MRAAFSRSRMYRVVVDVPVMVTELRVLLTTKVVNAAPENDETDVVCEIRRDIAHNVGLVYRATAVSGSIRTPLRRAP